MWKDADVAHDIRNAVAIFNVEPSATVWNGDSPGSFSRTSDHVCARDAAKSLLVEA